MDKSDTRFTVVDEQLSCNGGLNVKIRRKYNRLHAACPSCGGTSIEMTLMGFPGWSSLEGAVDDNLCTCDCGWHGIRHDMVPIG